MTEPVTELSGSVHAEDLKIFYENYFPFDKMYSWLSYEDAKGSGSEDVFAKREFNFTFITPTGDEIYARNQSFNSRDQFIEDLAKSAPHKIDIGGIYPYPPKQHASHFTDHSKQVKQRELVFDIDMDDYSSVRRCCDNGKAKKLCMRCWPFLHVAIQVIKTALIELFGLENFFFVFSGRRGIHCWVADERARFLSSLARSAILEFLTLPLQITDTTVPVQPNYKSLHPFMRQIYDNILLPVFENEIMIKQNLFDTEDAWNCILKFIPDQAVRDKLNESWSESESSPEEKWEEFQNTVNAEINEDRKERKGKNKPYIKRFSSNPIIDVVFAFTYPRFDKHVSIGLNHLLKAPFCIHPETGKLCVPIDHNKSLSFNPETVPTIDTFIKEYSANIRGSKSSMGRYEKLFDNRFLRKLNSRRSNDSNDIESFQA